ncbi:polar amino acid transport system permease protein [Bradyrhizobium japonicum]
MGFQDLLSQYWGQFVAGTLVSLQQFLLATTVAVCLATLLGLMKISPITCISWTARVYIEFFRGTSLIVQLYWIFYVLPIFGLALDRYVAGFLAIGMNMGAYGAEIVRGSILAVPRGQWEAASALSMSPIKRMTRIIFPQALVIMIPAWGNMLISIIKATSLVSLIGVTDLMFQANLINQDTYKSAQVFGMALVFYYVAARFVVTPLVRAFERTLRHNLSRS